jgi:hypothetical protein
MLIFGIVSSRNGLYAPKKYEDYKLSTIVMSPWQAISVATLLCGGEELPSFVKRILGSEINVALED